MTSSVVPLGKRDAPIRVRRHKGAKNGATGAAEPAQARPLGYANEDMNREFALVLMGSKAVIIHEQDDGPAEDRVRILTLDAFRAWFLNRKTEFTGPDGKVKQTTWANLWLASGGRRQYHGIEFLPDPGDAAGTPGYFNLWRGFSVEPQAKPGGYAIFRDHLLTNLCRGDARLFRWVFAWFAHIVQRPRERIATALVCRGKMGTGKTKIGEVFGSLFPAHYFLVDDPRYLVGQFNAHMASCLLLQADEGFWAGDKAAEGRLKGLVSSEIQMIEQKGIDPIRVKNYLRLLITSNEDWVIPAGKDERRFAVLDVDPRCAQNTTYFREMDEQLDDGGRAALLHDLLAVELGSVDLRHIPRTDALLEQKLRSLDPVESWWFERLVAGATTRSSSAWVDAVPCDGLFDDFVASADRVGIRRKAEVTSFGMKLKKLIPGVARARMTIDVDSVARRVWGYHLPRLPDCRAAFERELGHRIDWVDEEGSTFDEEPDLFVCPT